MNERWTNMNASIDFDRIAKIGDIRCNSFKSLSAENSFAMSLTEVFFFKQDFATDRCGKWMKGPWTKQSYGIPYGDQMAENGYIPSNRFNSLFS